MIGSPARDDAADRVDGRLVHHAVLRRADVDALELVLGRDLALDELADLAVDLAQVLGDLAAQILIDLQDLQLDLGDLALGLGGRRDELAALALEPRRLALERGQLGDRHEVLAPEIADALELLADQLDFLLLRRDCWPVRPWISSLSCAMRCRSCAFWPARRLARNSNSLRSPVIDRGDARGRRPWREAPPGRRWCRRRRARLRAGPCGHWSSSRPLVTMARLARVTVSSSRTTMSPALTLVAVAHPQLADDAAGRVLHLLDVGIDDDDALRDQAPDNLIVAAQPPTPPASSVTITSTAKQCGGGSTVRRDCALACLRSLGFTTLRSVPPPARTCPASRPRGLPGAAEHLGQHLVLRAEGLGAPLRHHQQQVDAGERARAVGDHDDDAAARAHAQDGLASAPRSPSASRLEFGSSSTTRNGIAVERARQRDALRAARPTAPLPPSPTWVS